MARNSDQVKKKDGGDRMLSQQDQDTFNPNFEASKVMTSQNTLSDKQASLNPGSLQDSGRLSGPLVANLPEHQQ